MKYAARSCVLGASHRGIAGIIVALVLVAIAVVGGIVVFTFMQGFISETQVTGPTFEVIQIFGYDTSDTNALTSHTGVSIAAINTGAPDNILDDTDAFAIYVRNSGSTTVVISEIRVYGTAYTVAAAATACSADETPVPAIGQYSLSSDGTLANCGQGSIAGGEEVTVYVRYAESTNGEVALGRPIPVTMVTANGLEITKSLSNGVQVG